MPAEEKPHYPRPHYPRYVRILAVCHVLSYAAQPVGCIVLGVLACIHGFRHGFDEWTVSFGLGGVLWLVLCVQYRAWFVRWGRRHWPEPDEPLPAEQVAAEQNHTVDEHLTNGSLTGRRHNTFRLKRGR